MAVLSGIEHEMPALDTSTRPCHCRCQVRFVAASDWHLNSMLKSCPSAHFDSIHDAMYRMAYT